MPAEENKSLVRRYFEQVDTGDVTILDRFISPNYQDHNPPPFPGLAPGLEGAKQSFALALAAFAEFRHVVEAQLAENDKVVTRVTGYGTHTGDFLGIPATGKEVKMAGIAIHRVANGKLAEHWAHIDALGLLQQLGIVPAPPPAPGGSAARPARGAGARRAGTPAENKAVVRQFVERAQSSGLAALMTAIDELMSPNFSESSGMNLGVPPTRDGMRQLFTMLHTAFPDLRTTIHDQVAEGDKVTTRKTFNATHRGELMGIRPTGKRVAIQVMDIVQVADGKIVEHWGGMDRLGLMVQLGVVPAPGSGG